MGALRAGAKPTGHFRAVGRVLRDPGETWLVLRTLGWMGVLPVFKRVLPLPRLVRLMWVRPRDRGRDRQRDERTVQVVGRLSRASGGNCLERSLVLYRFLSRTDADPRLVVGMAKSDVYIGHVWVTVDGQPLLEAAETLRGYEQVTAFGPEGRRLE